MKTKPQAHTPGPWHVVGEVDAMYSNIQVLAEDNAFIVRVNSSNHSNKANARLIAAAPELLASLKEMVEWCVWNTDYLARAKAAIAKAVQS